MSIVRIAANVATGGTVFFGDVVELFGELFATLLGERRNRYAHHFAVIRWIEPEVGGANRLFDGADLRLVPRLHGQQLWFGHVD